MTVSAPRFLVLGGFLLLAVFVGIACLTHGLGGDDCCEGGDCSDCQDCHCASCACLALATIDEKSDSFMEVSRPGWVPSKVMLIPQVTSAIFHPPRRAAI